MTRRRQNLLFNSRWTRLPPPWPSIFGQIDATSSSSSAERCRKVKFRSRVMVDDERDIYSRRRPKAIVVEKRPTVDDCSVEGPHSLKVCRSMESREVNSLFFLYKAHLKSIFISLLLTCSMFVVRRWWTSAFPGKIDIPRWFFFISTPTSHEIFLHPLRRC